MPIRPFAFAAAITLSAAAPTVQAQVFATDRAVWQVGGNVFLSRSRTIADNVPPDASTTVSLAPRLGYFVLPGLAVTGNLSLAYSGSDLGHQWSWGAGPGLTYYFGRGVRTVYPYVSGVTLFQWARSDPSSGSLPTIKSDARRWQLSGGAVVLVARNVGLNGEVYYSRTYQSTSAAFDGGPALDNSFTFEDYGLQFGVSLFVY